MNLEKSVESRQSTQGVEQAPGTFVIMAILILGTLFYPPVFADTPGPFDNIQNKAQQRLNLPEFKEQTDSTPLQLPAPPPEQRNRLSSGLAIDVRHIELIGNTVFSKQVLHTITSKYEHRTLDTEDLQELRLALTQHYINAGYINSGAIVPDQQIRDGIVKVRIIEGQLSKIQISGNNKLRDRFIASRLAIVKGKALDVVALRDQLLLLRQYPFVDRINARLIPTTSLGDARLDIQLKEKSPWTISVEMANDRSPSVGSIRTQLFTEYSNLTGWGDLIGLRYGLTNGSDNISLSYTVPVSAQDTRVCLKFDRSDATVIEEPFKDLDIESTLESVQVGISHPFLKTPSDRFVVGLWLDRRHSETFLLGRPFSFSSGVKDGKSSITALRFSQDYTERQRTQVLAAHSTFSWGLNSLGATNNAMGPDGQFFSWLGQIQWAKKMNAREHQFIARADLQLAEKPLLPLEQCALGGANSVRGYRVNQLVRDHCFLASVEYRMPLLRLPIPGLSKHFKDGWLEFATFIDIGAAKNRKRPAPPGEQSLSTATETITSSGIGIRWKPSATILAEIYWGYAFEAFEQADHDLQDDGVNFRIVVGVF